MRIFLDGVRGPGRAERLPPARLEQMHSNRSTLRAAMLGSGVPPVGPADVERVGVPVLLLTGEESPTLLVAPSARLGELLPRAEQLRIPGASHVMHEESPAAVNQAILGFLERLPRTPSGQRQFRRPDADGTRPGPRPGGRLQLSTSKGSRGRK